MSDPTDFPYSPLRDALTSMLSRLGFIVGAVVVGSLLGCVSATGSLIDGVMRSPGAPFWALSSILYGPSVFVLGMLVVFTILYTTWEWPRWLATVAVLLMWWDIHLTLSHVLEQEARFARLIPRQDQNQITHSP